MNRYEEQCKDCFYFKASPFRYGFSGCTLIRGAHNLDYRCHNQKKVRLATYLTDKINKK